MEDVAEYFLQVEKGGDWISIAKSYENAALIFAAEKRGEHGQLCRVVSRAGDIIWQGKGALENEDAHQGNG